MRNIKQSGFAAIEAILVCVIVGIIGFTGFFVWNAKQKTDDSLSNTANSQPALQSKKVAATPASKPTYLNITEWGVKLPLDDEHSDVVYCNEQRDSGENYIYFSASSLGGFQKVSSSDCGESVGALNRVKLGDPIFVGGQSVAATIELLSDAPKIGNYYFTFESSHATFKNDASLDVKADSLASFLAGAVKNIQAL